MLPRFACCAALIAVALSAAPASSQPAPAQPGPAPMPGMTPPPLPPSSASDTAPSSRAFEAAAERMMQGMNVKMTGNPDQDFVSGMIPHHQGAVDMAKIELQYGKDPEMRRLARRIVKTQDREIAEMQAWQKRHPAAP